MTTVGGNISNTESNESFAIYYDNIEEQRMTEAIEIHSYPTKNEDDIQEYDEINEETQFYDTITFSNKKCDIGDEKPNEYDFFTGINVVTSNKSVKKHKKPKKTGKSSNLMEIINSEISASTPPITENIINIIQYNTRQKTSLLKNNTILEIITKNQFYGEGHKSQPIINLSPIFPRVLENRIRENNEIPVEYVEPFIYNNLIENYKDTLSTNVVTKFLDITLKNLKFTHHHKFSLEKLLSIRLRECYCEYEKINKILNDLSRDIKVNRETKNNFKLDLIKINPNKENSIRFDPIIRKYTGRLLHLRDIYMKTLKSKKEIIHKIQSLWSDIEMVRIKSKYTLTSCILNVYSKQCNKDELEKQWIDLFNLEFTDELDKIESDYVSKYIEYKAAKHEQKLKKSKLNEIFKPKLIIDEDGLNEKVEKNVNDIIACNKIELIFKEDINMISENVKLKLNTLESVYCFEIYVDDIFVCESEKYKTDKGKFDLDFIEMFSIQILPNNKNISIVLIENNERASHAVIDLTDLKKSNNNPDFMREFFSYDTTIKPTSKYVGSGNTIKEIAVANKVRLKCCGMFQSALYTTAEVYMQLKWNVKLSENYTEEIRSTVEIGRKIKRILHGIDKPNIDILNKLIKDLFDKDVSEDETMFNNLKDLCRTEFKMVDTLPIDENGPEFLRFKLLHVRNNGGFDNLENKIIPLNVTQISTEQLNCLRRTNDKDFDLDYLTENGIDLDPIELQRFIGTKYIERLNKNMLKNLNSFLLRKTYKDVVVRDFNSFSFRDLFTHSNDLTRGSLSNVTKQQILRESLDQSREIKITVLRAFNLLDRSAALLEDAEDDDKIAGLKIRPLRPFVHVSYHGISAQTLTAVGCHPSWNHTLKINTILGPLSSLHINVYDEYKAKISEDRSDEEHSNKTIYYKYYNKWLGTLEIPMYNVLASGALRGTFKIITPPMTFGYENPETKGSTSIIIPEIHELLKKESSFIALEISTDLSYLGRLQQYNQPANPSDDDLIKHLNTFTTQYTNDFPFRNVSLTFIDSDGNNKCVTEFLRAIPVPNQSFFPKNRKSCESAGSKSSGFSKSSGGREIDVERGEWEEDRYTAYSAGRSGDVILKMIHVCMRYVALIPSYELTESHAITLTGLELLKILYGSPLDHTILLASYFLYLEIKCWVAIGSGLPRGPSSYVLIKYDLGTNRIVQVHDQQRGGFFNRNYGYLWYVCDSITGEKFELREAGCPLKAVDYVFDNENIWVNVQSTRNCDGMSFDFTRSSDWQPVFGKSIFIPKPIAKEISLYTNPRDVEGLRQTLEAKIKAKVQKWRPHVKTVWNRYCGTLLRESLPQWEHWAFNPMDQKPGVGQKLKQFMAAHRMFGFPLNVPFTSTKAVISRAKSTGLHHNDDPSVEFAIGLDLYSYPNNVISVWVYLATLTKI